VTAQEVFNFIIVGVVVIVTLISRVRRAATRDSAGPKLPALPATEQAAAQYGAQQAAARRASVEQLAARQAAAQQAAAQQAARQAGPQRMPAPPPAPPQPQSQARRAIQPTMRSTEIPFGLGLAGAAPPPRTGSMLADAFGDPAHARNAVILAEVLSAPVALR
jgi:hypothetical protein